MLDTSSSKLLNAAKEVEYVLKESEIDEKVKEKLKDLMSQLCFYSALLDTNSESEELPNNVIPFKK
jgi:DNA-binding transcriptional regulator GbsR (MarR family)